VLGEDRESEAVRERRRLWRQLLDLCQPPSLIRFRRDVAQRDLDRLLSGPPPKVRRWNPYSGRRALAYGMWQVLLALQAQRARLDGCATL
jgi:hypothetical protein